MLIVAIVDAGRDPRLDQPTTTEKGGLCDEGCPKARLSLWRHQRAQTTLSTAAGGLGMTSAARRRATASVGSLPETLPAMLVSIAGPL